MVLPEHGEEHDEGSAMEWATMHTLSSPFAVQLAHEVSRPVGVEKEEEDNLDERARVLHQINTYRNRSVVLRFKSDLARQLVHTDHFAQPKADIGTAILAEDRPDAFQIFEAKKKKIRDANRLELLSLGEPDEDGLSPRAESGDKEVLRKTVLNRRAEMARDFPNMTECVFDAEAQGHEAELSSEEEADVWLEQEDEQLGGQESLPSSSEEEEPSPAATEPATEAPTEAPTEAAAVGESVVHSTPLLEKFASVESPTSRPTTSGEPTSPRMIAMPPSRPQTVPTQGPPRPVVGFQGSPIVGFAALSSPVPPQASPSVGISPWHLDSLANRSKRGLSTQISQEFRPLVIGNISPVRFQSLFGPSLFVLQKLSF